MTDRPILFSGPMVRAILDGRKTQTRRVLNNDRFASIFNDKWTNSYVLDPGNAEWRQREVRYTAGDRLWVRENIGRRISSFMGIEATNGVEEAFYAADGADVLNEHEFNICPWWKRNQILPGIHMPRWASRLTLTVTDVRVQRLQEIGEADALAEGAVQPWTGSAGSACDDRRTALSEFEALWDSINAKRGFGWEANPWVVAISFSVQHGNIDQVRP